MRTDKVVAKKRQNFKKELHEHFKEENAKKKKTGAYAEDPYEFRHDYRLTKENKETSDKLFDQLYQEGNKSIIVQKKKDFEILIANLINQKRKPIKFSFDNNNWGKGRYKSASYSTWKSANKLIENKYVMKVKEGVNAPNYKRVSRIEAEDKLRELFPELHSAVIIEPVELVELHKTEYGTNGKKLEKKSLVDYNENELPAKTQLEITRIRGILKRLNKVNSEADIRAGKYKLSSNSVAIFTDSFDLYGRIHAKGFSHQQGSGDKKENADFYRKDITINGNRIIELDYKALHPHLLYAKIKQQYPDDKDPYSVVFPEITNPNDSNIARSFLKILLLAMLNSKDKIIAESAANHHVYKEKISKDLIRIGIIKKVSLDEFGKVIEKFKEAHEPIAHFLCTGNQTGLKLMNKDSKIALAVVDHFAKQGFPILPVHDSFIVEEQHEDKLKSVMEDVYRKQSHGFKIPVR